jgi:hypothetical protein
VAAVTRRHAPHEKRAAGQRFWARFTSHDRPTPMPAGGEWVG